MDDKMIPAQGGLYTPEELASAYAERGERIEELLRLNDRLDARITELEEVTAAVTVLVNWVNKDKADNADLEDRIDGLESDLSDVRSDLDEADFDEVRSDLSEVRSDLDRAINCIRDAAAELASI
jgi:chromosome segregation ATPase